MRKTAMLATVLATVVFGAAVAEGQQPAPSGATRMERDLLGEKAVPADAYYGVQTARALEIF